MFLKPLQFFRFYSSARPVSYFTTPIYYVNAEPHIGHLYSSAIADASQRWQRLQNKKVQVKLSTGTDEHGTKIQRAASTHKTTVNAYCDNVSSKYKILSDKFSIQYTDFIRTSEVRHKQTVQHFWNKLSSNGHIYKSTYEGWYCVSDETFLSGPQLKEIEKNGEKILISAESGHPVEWTQETNYIFKLKSFKDNLIYWLKQNENAVVPQKFYKILLNLINTDNVVSDISISRPTTRVHWGIPVPGDEEQTVYVWLDALVNYLTAAGYSQIPDKDFEQCWPPTLQVIGKDILKFHGVYWPAFLMAANLEPPRCILCHSHWTVDGEKMSKSKQNVVDPIAKAELVTEDGIRYFLLREGVNQSDGNYSNTKLLRMLNAELADTLGNLLSRCCGKILNPDQTFPQLNSEAFDRIASLDVTKQLLKSAEELPAICAKHYNEFNFYKAVDAIVATLHASNLFFESLKPWELKKNANTLDDLNVTLHLTMETLRIAGTLLQPIIPNISKTLLDKLNVPLNERHFDNLERFSWQVPDFKARPLNSETAVLFKRIIFNEENKRKTQRG